MRDLYQALKPPTRRWIDALKKRYVLECYHERLLLLAGQSWDRAKEAGRMIKEEGAVLEDRFHQKKVHPAVGIEAQSMIAFSKLLRECGLDLEKPEEPRPACRPGGYK